MSSFLTFLFLIILIPVGYAADNISMDTTTMVAITQPSASSPAGSFGVIVTKDSKLITKPGPVFTEGGDYEGMLLPYLVSDPKLISYPRWAIHNGWHGECAIAIEVLTNGSVGRYKVTRSTGYQMLDEEAVKAVKSWKFHPAVKDGKAMVTCIQVPITFQLQME